MNRFTDTRSPSTPVRGLAGAVRRTARASARRPKTVIALWLLMIVGLVVAGSMSGTREMTATEAAVGDSGRAERLLDDAGLQDPAVESVLVTSPDHATTAAAAAGLAQQLGDMDRVSKVSAPGDPELTADSGRAQLVQVTLRGDPEHAADHVAGVEQRVSTYGDNHPEATFEQTGGASMENATEKIVEDDLGRAELVSLPLILAILLVAFGAFVAASVPLMLGITAVAGAMGAAGLISQLVPDSGSTASLIVLIGLAVGVDYSLFYIRREREERRAGKGAEATLDATASTVGRAIAVSGLTVIVALAGLLVTGLAVFASIALGTMVVVALAVLGSVTVLPAFLQLLGERVERGRVPLLGRLASRGSQRIAFWPRVVALVARRPRGALVASAGVLVALAVPAVGMHLGETTAEDLPADIPAVSALSHVEALFPGAPADARLVVSGSDLRSGDAREGLGELGRSALEVTGGQGSPAVSVSGDGRTAVVDVPMPEMSNDEATATVAELRDDVAPAYAGGEVLVTGDAAESADFTTALRDAMPVVVAMVLALAFVLLVAAFRSPALAAAVIGLNLLSVGAAYGVMVAVFQHGLGADLLSVTETGFVVSWVPLFAFVILFGLSMDYTVVVLERIREGRLAGLTAREAVAEGVGATAGAVTSAAAVMIAVFSLFAMLRLPEMEQLGIGLGSAVLIDATIVRGIALPAVVALLGERRWRVRRPRRSRRGSAEIIDRRPDARLTPVHDR